MTKTMMLASATVLAMLSGQAMAATAPIANPAASLSVGKSVRSGTATTRKSKALAGTGAIVVGVLAAGAIVGAVIAISDDNSDSN